MKTLNEIIAHKDIPNPKKKYYLGWVRHGTPYFYPWNFIKSGLKLIKGEQKFLRKLSGWRVVKLPFGYTLLIGNPITWHINDLGWKDKYDTPRFEWSPAFHIYFFYWQFSIFWVSPLGNDTTHDTYWESALWLLNYSGGDIKEARKTYPWVDSKTRESTFVL